MKTEIKPILIRMSPKEFEKFRKKCRKEDITYREAVKQWTNYEANLETN